MTTLPFNNLDSWAIWNVPSDLPEDPADKEKAFGENYQSETFPSAQLPNDLSAYLKQTKYVLIGMNPGNAVVDHPADQAFLNFHGQKKSMDYRLAAATYGTDLWGAFMTDLSHTIDSKSNNVEITETDVAELEQHLDELGIPSDATLVALGNKAFTPLSKFAKRPVKTIPHYSGSNGHWKAEKVHENSLEVTQH